MAKKHYACDAKAPHYQTRSPKKDGSPPDECLMARCPGQLSEVSKNPAEWIGEIT